jgi:hypothetical protein
VRCVLRAVDLPCWFVLDWPWALVLADKHTPGAGFGSHLGSVPKKTFLNARKT